MMQVIRITKCPGWLAIPASLALLLTGCQSPPPVPVNPAVAAAPQVISHEILEPDADVWILSFFDLYCVACQQSGDNFARLHARIEKETLADTVRSKGIGLGDTAFEVEVFLKRYPLGYPCEADPDKILKDVFSIKGTPTVLVFERRLDGWSEIHRHEGRFRSDDIDSVLEIIPDRLLKQNQGNRP